MRELLLEAEVDRVILIHPYLDQADELLQLVREGAVCIIPLRHSDDVRASWKKYGKDLRDYAGMTFEEWYAAQAEIADAATRLFYLEIDTPGRREQQLAEINRELGLDLVTDWQPVRQDGPTDQREQIAQQFLEA
jgi:hypothetical protein